MFREDATRSQACLCCILMIVFVGRLFIFFFYECSVISINSTGFAYAFDVLDNLLERMLRIAKSNEI